MTLSVKTETCLFIIASFLLYACVDANNKVFLGAMTSVELDDSSSWYEGYLYAASDNYDCSKLSTLIGYYQNYYNTLNGASKTTNTQSLSFLTYLKQKLTGLSTSMPKDSSYSSLKKQADIIFNGKDSYSTFQKAYDYMNQIYADNQYELPITDYRDTSKQIGSLLAYFIWFENNYDSIKSDISGKIDYLKSSAFNFISCSKGSICDYTTKECKADVKFNLYKLGFYWCKTDDDNYFKSLCLTSNQSSNRLQVSVVDSSKLEFCLYNRVNQVNYYLGTSSKNDKLAMSTATDACTSDYFRFYITASLSDGVFKWSFKNKGLNKYVSYSVLDMSKFLRAKYSSSDYYEPMMSS